MDPRLASANSLSDVARYLAGSPLLARPLADVATAFGEDDPRHALFIDLARRWPGTVDAFLANRPAHRKLPVPYPRVVGAFVYWAQRNEAGAFDTFLDAADTFGTLAPLVRGTDAGGARLSDAVVELKLRHRLRTQLFSLALHHHFSVAEFLDRADDLLWADRDFFAILDAFKDWLRRHLVRPATDAVIPLQALPDRVTLLRRVDALGIPDLLNWPVAMLQVPPPARAPWTAPLRVELERPTRALVDTLTRFEAAVAQLRRQPPAEPPPTPEPALAPLQATARAERLRLATGWPRGLGVSNLQYRAQEAALDLIVNMHGSPHSHRLRIDDVFRFVRAPTITCTCDHQPACVHRVAVLDFLWAAGAADADFRDALLRAVRPPWERLLDAITAAPAAPTAPRPRGLLAFVLDERTVELRLHPIGKRGPSKTSRQVSPTEALLAVDGVDRQLAERFAIAASATSPRSPLFGDALLQLAGHPRVHWYDGREPPRPATRVEGTVRVTETDEGYRLAFAAGDWPLEGTPATVPCSTGEVAVVGTDDGRVLLAHFSPAFTALLHAAHATGADLPREALPRFTQLLPTLEAGATVELPDELRGDERPPATRLLARISSAPAGLSLSLRVEPLEGGPVFVPGHGVPVSATFDGRRRAFTRRDFTAELAEANALATRLGLDPTACADPFTFSLSRAPEHIEALRRLEALGVPVEWQAPRVKFTREASLASLRLSITKKRDWFGLEGEVEVDDRRVALAALLEAARERRRFVELAEGEYAQLSEALVERLAPLAHLGAPGKPAELPLGAAPLIDALAPEVQAVEAAQEWQALMARLADARDAAFPVPRALEATLRDYQREGFEWLSRLAQWARGAVLADDMGLGKTLQALAFLLARAKLGPALVVAPSSVLHTWRTEAARFAPKLQLHLFHEGDRSLGGLGKGDVVVASWSLFAREAETFAKTRFSTVVLDEAHAIKNAGTQRAKAAHRLDADFVVALTGTPVENHVGELWSLFRATMPALLGSEESFRARFGSGSKEALAALAQLVKPFILRRTKAAVARELPPRTDLDVLVPLTPEERALYDDVRLSAVAELGDVTGESKRFDVLAALTRLRLTACHPKLVDAGWNGPTSKLDRLLELLRDLAAGGHRVLVFSQFTSHLALVVDALRREGVTHSYLDGQVPVAERQQRVEAFQRGEGGDVFLISLKAGGTGLTLTAADYVIHLDPWWNPAVEDQASDRAHRIGQDKPVTVYRLIAEGTIEQQILSLHAEKRELVDALLAGTDAVGKLTTKQLAELIRGEA
ncbi:MAG: DEAD/DEAH box helicase [Myxococcota bacterium]